MNYKTASSATMPTVLTTKFHVDTLRAQHEYLLLGPHSMEDKLQMSSNSYKRPSAVENGRFNQRTSPNQIVRSSTEARNEVCISSAAINKLKGKLAANAIRHIPYKSSPQLIVAF